MLLPALSVITGLIVLVITIDHLGSRRVRSRVRRRAQRFFAEAKSLPLPAESISSTNNREALETVRLKLKESRRLAPKGSWYPVEAKLFLAAYPLAGVYYADWTRAPFVSEKQMRWLEGDQAGEERRLLSVFRLSAKKKLSPPLAWWVLQIPWYPSLLHHPDLNVDPLDTRGCRLTWVGDDRWGVDLLENKEGQWTESVLYGFRQKKEQPLLRCYWKNYKNFGHWSVPTELITEQHDHGSWWQTGQTQLTDWVPNEEFKWW